MHAVRGVDLQAPAALAVVAPSRRRRPGRSSRRGCRIPWCSASTQIDVSCTFRCTGCASSCTLPAKNTEASRSRGGSVRSTQPRSGEVYSSSFSSADQSAVLRSVQGAWPFSSDSMPALTIAKYRPRLNAGLKLRTACSSRWPSDARQRASKPAVLPVSARCSAASTPERIAW